MKLQKCRPSFFDARDAIIQADQVLTGGENFCALWKGFGDRGLGPDADVKGRTDWGGGIRQDVCWMLAIGCVLIVLVYRVLLSQLHAEMSHSLRSLRSRDFGCGCVF